jgi:hypothetical protein
VLKLNIREIGKIFGYLASAYASSSESFVKRRIEEAMATLSQVVEQKSDTYREIIEGVIDARVPLKLLVNVCSFLPGKPLIGEVFGKSEGFFVKEGETLKTIIGVNENGKSLVNSMVTAVRERAKESNKKSENPKNLSKKHEGI